MGPGLDRLPAVFDAYDDGYAAVTPDERNAADGRFSPAWCYIEVGAEIPSSDKALLIMVLTA
jgi:hypothetical protein